MEENDSAKTAERESDAESNVYPISTNATLSSLVTVTLFPCPEAEGVIVSGDLCTPLVIPRPSSPTKCKNLDHNILVK